MRSISILRYHRKINPRESVIAYVFPLKKIAQRTNVRFYVTENRIWIFWKRPVFTWIPWPEIKKCSQTHGWQTLWSFVKQSVACLYPHSIRYCQTQDSKKKVTTNITRIYTHSRARARAHTLTRVRIAYWHTHTYTRIPSAKVSRAKKCSSSCKSIHCQANRNEGTARKETGKRVNTEARERERKYRARKKNGTDMEIERRDLMVLRWKSSTIPPIFSLFLPFHTLSPSHSHSDRRISVFLSVVTFKSA